MTTVILGIGAAIAVVIAVLVCVGLLVSVMVRKAKKGKKAASIADAAPSTPSPFAKAEAEFREMMDIVQADSHDLFIEDYKAEKRAKFEALKAKAK